MTLKPAAIAGTLTVTLTLGLAACGGGDSGLGKDELIAKGDAICKAGDEAIQQKATALFKSSPSASDLVRFARQEVGPAYRDELAKLKALEPDGDSSAGWNDMIAKLESGVEAFVKDPAAAIKGGTSPLEEAGQAAREFGMKECGSQD